MINMVIYNYNVRGSQGEAAMKKQKIIIKVKGQGKVSRVLLGQVVPFVVMLVLVSALTLWVGQQIEQHRDQPIDTAQVSFLQHF